MDAIVLLDSKGHIVECNEKANELFVCGCRRVDGWHVSGLFPEFQSTGERTEDLFREFVSYVGESKHTVFEMTGNRCDGTEICLVVKLSRVEYLNSVAFLVNMSEATTMRQLVPRCGASF